MKKLYRSLLVLTAVFLLTNCINVEMETVINKDRSGKGKLVYAWDPAQDIDHIDIDQTFATIANNPTVQVTGNQEYDSEGIHYREITWIFEDINEVDLEGLTYFYGKEDGKMMLRAVFQEMEQESISDPAAADSLHNSVQENNAAALDEMLYSGTPPESAAESQAGTDSNIPATGDVAASAGTSSGTPGLTPQEQMQMDAETQAQMEEMFNVMIRAALDGYSVKFHFTLPQEILEAPGAEINGTTAIWDIPLKELIDPAREGAYDEFRMVMKPE